MLYQCVATPGQLPPHQHCPIPRTIWVTEGESTGGYGTLVPIMYPYLTESAVARLVGLVYVCRLKACWVCCRLRLISPNSQLVQTNNPIQSVNDPPPGRRGPFRSLAFTVTISVTPGLHNYTVVQLVLELSQQQCNIRVRRRHH